MALSNRENLRDMHLCQVLRISFFILHVSMVIPSGRVHLHKKSLLLRHHLIHLSGQIWYYEGMQWKTWLHGFVNALVPSLWFPRFALLSCWGLLEYSWLWSPVQKDSSVLVHRGGLRGLVVRGQEVVREVEVSQDQLSGSAEPKRHTVMGRAPLSLLSLFWFWLFFLRGTAVYLNRTKNNC